jgi:hypothetical protein
MTLEMAGYILGGFIMAGVAVLAALLGLMLHYLFGLKGDRQTKEDLPIEDIQ